MKTTNQQTGKETKKQFVFEVDFIENGKIESIKIIASDFREAEQKFTHGNPTTKITGTCKLDEIREDERYIIGCFYYVTCGNRFYHSRYNGIKTDCNGKEGYHFTCNEPATLWSNQRNIDIFMPI